MSQGDSLNVPEHGFGAWATINAARTKCWSKLSKLGCMAYLATKRSSIKATVGGVEKLIRGDIRVLSRSRRAYIVHPVKGNWVRLGGAKQDA